MQPRTFVTVVLGFISLLPGGAIATETGQQALVASWESKTIPVETARVRFLQVFLMREEIRPTSRAGLLDQLKRHSDFTNEDHRRALAEEWCSDRLPEDRRTWIPHNALRRGNEFFIEGGGRVRSVTTSSDVSRSFGQVSLYEPGKSKLFYYTIENLREVPTKGLVQHSKWEQQDDGRVRLTYHSVPLKTDFEMVIDRQTGFVHHARQLDFEGNLLQEDFQFQPTSFGAGIIFPRYRVRCEYFHENIVSLDATCLEEATFNKPVDDDEFVVQIRPGETVVDFRKTPPRAFKAK
jgi:hypothetical protein